MFGRQGVFTKPGWLPEINSRTLMMAIQAVDSKIREIVEQFDADASELEMLLLG